MPELLAAPVPEWVSAGEAAHETLGPIAMQGIRNDDVRMGEYVVTIGLVLLS